MILQSEKIAFKRHVEKLMKTYLGENYGQEDHQDPERCEKGREDRQAREKGLEEPAESGQKAR